MDSDDILRISSIITLPCKLFLYVVAAMGLSSMPSRTVIPLSSSPRDKPPAPQNKSIASRLMSLNAILILLSLSLTNYLILHY